MTDEELIARLRDDVFYGDERLHNLSRHNPLHMEAADRIEALIAERDAAEAKLAENEVRLGKAVEALEFLEIAATGSGVPHPKERELLHDCIRKARTTLAEIKSHSDEFATQKGENHE